MDEALSEETGSATTCARHPSRRASASSSSARYRASKRCSLLVWPGTSTSEAGKGRAGSVVGRRARMGGEGGAAEAALEAAARLLGLRGRAARVGGGGNGGDDDAEDADADAEEGEEETTSLESSLSSGGAGGFADAFARRIDMILPARRCLRGFTGDREGATAMKGCGLDETATPAASIFFLKQIERRKVSAAF